MTGRRKRYRIKPRFFLILSLLLCLLIGSTVFAFLRSDGKGEENGDSLREQYLQGFSIMMAAKVYISNENLRYDDSYFAGGYPPDDIGVCTDVVWKGLAGIDVSLKDLVDADIAENPQAYSQVVSVPDPNIDFRLVPVLEVFFQRNAQVLTTDPDAVLAWQPGDLVTFESSHIAVVSNLRNIWGRPYIIQHGKDPAAEEDRLVASDGMEISGHYRWPVTE